MPGQAAMGDAVEAELAVVPDPTAAAFFDVDNTVMRGASIFHLARGLAARKFFTSRDIAGFAWDQLKFLVVGIEDMDAMAEATEAALGFVKGRSVAEINRLGDEIFTEIMVDKLWPGTLALAQGHLDEGQRVWLVTASPIELATIIARRLGLTGALGTVSGIVDGVYTGRLVGAPLHGEAKADAVRGLAAREGLDLSRCSAYSDSANDIPMLSVVGHPVAVNPDAALRAHAREQGWAVRDYRRARMRRRVGIPAGAVAATALVVGIAIGAVAATRHRRR
jgi:HAD superfamily hydrolase (TIGR01490 family)